MTDRDDRPRDDLIRMMSVPVELRTELRADDDADDGRLGTLQGHFAVFNEWTTIDSWWEGRFRERFSPGAFKKTFKENRDSIKVLYDHGFDPELGNKPLGPIEELSEDKVGAWYEVPLIDTSYNRDFIVPALEAELLGASFRFSVVKEVWVEPDEDSADLPERTVKEARVFEFGPVTFPAYLAASAGVRGRIDFGLWQSLDEDGRLDLLRLMEKAKDLGTPGKGAAAPDRSEPPPHSPIDRAVLEQRARRIRNTLDF